MKYMHAQVFSSNHRGGQRSTPAKPTQKNVILDQFDKQPFGDLLKKNALSITSSGEIGF